jgi:hypothetical protein
MEANLMELFGLFIGSYLGNLPVALIMACIAKVWSKNVSWKRIIGYGIYFNILPSIIAVLNFALDK